MDTSENSEENGGPVSEVRHRREDLDTVSCHCSRVDSWAFSKSVSKGMCARIAVEGAKCIICLREAPKNQHVVLLSCGHWVERICFHLWCVKNDDVQCLYNCKGEQQGLRSPDLMSAEVRLAL